jgi:hypothetical protein
MRPTIAGGCLVVALFWSAAATAGPIFGTIVSEGQGLKGASVEIQCGKEAAVSATTTADGGYRINVPQQGQCTIALPSFKGASAVVFSNPNPTAYNFELLKHGDGKFELKRK